MASLVLPVKYGVINKYETTTNGSYVIQFISEIYTLQNNTKIDGKFIPTGKLVVKAQYLFSMQENDNWYWKKIHCNIIS